MKIVDLPFGTTDWETIGSTKHPGASGAAQSRTRQFGELRVRPHRSSTATRRLGQVNALV